MAMQERYLGRLRPDMDVCDLRGDKVGTVAHIYRYPEGAAGASGEGSPAAATEPPPYDEVLEVKTGLLGLGAHLYVPLSAVLDLLSDCVFLAKPKAEFESLGWRDKPAYRDQLQ
jgi:hypothetical protein